MSLTLRPQPGFQEKHLACQADIAIAGGAAGCGKTWDSVVEPLQWIHLPRFNAIIFRRTHAQLKGGDSIWEESLRIYPHFGGRANHSEYLWRFPSGATVKFGHLQHGKDKYNHQGLSYALIIFEELTHFEEDQWWYLYGRSRSMCPVRSYMRATCNPDSESFVADLVSWYIDEDGFAIPERDGVLRYFKRDGDNTVWADKPEDLYYLCDLNDPHDRPNSFTFIEGDISDNRALLEADPAYKSKLNSLQLIDRERLLKKNWKIRPKAGLYFQDDYFEIVSSPPSPIVASVRFWDKAATEAETPKTKKKGPSETAGVLLHRLENGRFYVEHAVSHAYSPDRVDRLMLRTASQDGPRITIGVFQDPAQAGVNDVRAMKRLLSQYNTYFNKVTKSKLAMAREPSKEAEHNGIYLQKGSWNRQFMDQHNAFPDGHPNDLVDAMSGAFDYLENQTRRIVTVNRHVP